MSILMASRVVRWAEECAQGLLGGLRPRIGHVLAVGAKARQIARVFDRADAQTLVASAYLHDIGYAPQLVDTGLHQIDGARWLRSQGHEDLADLVAHHSAAHVELRLRRRLELLEPYARPPHDLAAALAYCDITTGPQGQEVTLDERVAEVGQRRGRDSVVYQALRASYEELERAVAHTVERVDRLATTRVSSSVASGGTSPVSAMRPGSGRP